VRSRPRWEMAEPHTVVTLAGGVGGAKLARGIQAHLGPALTVVVNTADDFEMHGLSISPDHDTVMYTLAGLDNPDWGWGLAGESFEAARMLERYGEPTWFRLGDRDLATHVVRTARLRAGARPTDVARHLQRSLGVAATILPMTDAPVRTQVRTDEGWLAFQEYFVQRHHEPTVHEVRFRGLDAAAATPEVIDAIAEAAAIVIGPSNPIVSVGPILAVAGTREALREARRRGVPIVAVSGIIGGRAVKGPADRLLASLGHEPSALGVARLYRDLADAFILDSTDAALARQIERLGLRVLITDTLMPGDAERSRVAADVLGFVGIR
jgi:LPPG:FO 2-phospho-L-lactate transferase